MNPPKIGILIILTIGCFLTAVSQINAQTAPEFIVSWKAGSFAPSDYSGKIFPTKNTLVEIGFDLIDENKFVNLSNYTIYWFLDGKLIKKGKGLKGIDFKTTQLNNDHLARITIVNYKGNDLDKTVLIPVVSPEVVINLPYPNNEPVKEGQIIFQALAYFFNVSKLTDLNFDWSMDNQKISKGKVVRPDILNLEINSNNAPSPTFNLSVTVKNILENFEMATNFKNLKIK